jgi:hypothetical protein
MTLGTDVIFLKVRLLNGWFHKVNWERIRCKGRLVIPSVSDLEAFAHVRPLGRQVIGFISL